MPESPEPVHLEHVQILAARIAALEESQVENVREQRALQGQIRTLTCGVDDLRADVEQVRSESAQRADEHHVLITRINEKLDSMMQILKDRVEASTEAVPIPTFEISTPNVLPPGIMDTHTVEQARRSIHFAPQVETNATELPIVSIPLPRMASERVAASPPMTSFADSGAGYYQQRHVQPDPRYMAPELYAAQGSQPMGAPPPQSHHGQAPQQSLWGRGAPIMTSQNFKVCQKPNPRLFVFDGSMVNYELWRNRIRYHLCNRSTRRYESPLDNTEKTKDEILKHTS